MATNGKIQAAWTKVVQVKVRDIRTSLCNISSVLKEHTGLTNDVQSGLFAKAVKEN